MANRPCVRSYTWSFGHSDLDLSSVKDGLALVHDFALTSQLILQKYKPFIHTFNWNFFFGLGYEF